jgi:hypothetical protein
VPRLVITDVPVFDGEYELDLKAQPFNGWDAHILWKVAGLRLGELDEASTKGHYDLVIALAVIALRRTGNLKTIPQALEAADLLREAEIGKITYTADVEPPQASDALPPVSERASSGASGETAEPSGASSSTTGDPQESIPSTTGDPGSDTGSDSARATFFNSLQSS